MCPDCLKTDVIYAREVCKKCYYKAYIRDVVAKTKSDKKEDWWKSVKITDSDRELLRLSLLRMKYSYETAFDYMVINHLYLKYKAPHMAEYPDYGVLRYIDKIKSQLRLIFL
jgi:hypothetical protein